VHSAQSGVNATKRCNLLIDGNSTRSPSKSNTNLDTVLVYYNAFLQFLQRVPRSRACERCVSGTENVAERAENPVERNGAWSGRDRKRWSGNGAGSGVNRPLAFLHFIHRNEVATPASYIRIFGHRKTSQ